MASKRKAFLLRLNPEIYRALQKWADDELRSLNAQIEYVLREALRRQRRLGKPGPSSSSEPDERD